MIVMLIFVQLFRPLLDPFDNPPLLILQIFNIPIILHNILVQVIDLLFYFAHMLANYYLFLY